MEEWPFLSQDYPVVLFQLDITEVDLLDNYHTKSSNTNLLLDPLKHSINLTMVLTVPQTTAFFNDSLCKWACPIKLAHNFLRRASIALIILASLTTRTGGNKYLRTASTLRISLILKTPPTWSISSPFIYQKSWWWVWKWQRLRWNIMIIWILP